MGVIMYTKFEHAGYPCYIAQMSIHPGKWTHYTGYVAIPKTHPLYGASDIFESPLNELNVHGGVTYSSQHYPFPHEDDPLTPKEDLWLIGFDTAHGFDYWPDAEYHLGCKFTNSTIWTVDKLKEEVKSLAEQLRTMETK